VTVPRIYDLVTVTRERDLGLLEARFTEFAGVDAVHVIAESVTAYDQSPKPLHFYDQRKDRFAQWHGRWNHVRVEASELPCDQGPRERKAALREWLLAALTCGPDDIVLHGGVDEIPSAGVLADLGRQVLPAVLEMRLCAYTPRLVHPLPWRGTAAARRKDMPPTLAEMRDMRAALPALVNAGTRLAAIGEPARDRYGDGMLLRAAAPDATWPRWVASHPGWPQETAVTAAGAGP
jgi:hypothetical protein